MSISAAPNANLDSARERVGLFLSQMSRSFAWVRRRQAAASHDHERLLAFWRGGVPRELDSDWYCSGGAADGGCERKAEACWAAALPAKGQDYKHSLLPLKMLLGREIRVALQRDFWAQAQCG